MAIRQFAALPFRIQDAELCILLITTRRKRRWSVPKGSAIVARKPHRTAAIEAYEEAGLIGKVRTKAIGRYKHRKAKGKRRLTCDISVFPLEVREQKKRWPERGQRDVIWLPARKAAERVHKARLRRLIERFVRQKTGKRV